MSLEECVWKNNISIEVGNEHYPYCCGGLCDGYGIKMVKGVDPDDTAIIEKCKKYTTRTAYFKSLAYKYAEISSENLGEE